MGQDLVNTRKRRRIVKHKQDLRRKDQVLSMLYDGAPNKIHGSAGVGRSIQGLCLTENENPSVGSSRSRSY